MRGLHLLSAILAVLAVSAAAPAHAADPVAIDPPSDWRHDGHADEWRSLAPTLTLVGPGAGARPGRIWVARSNEGLVVAGAIEGGAPRFATDAATMPAGDHVELWISLADAIALPPIGWGHQFGPITVARPADCAGNENIPDASACRAWLARQYQYRRKLGRLFVRQWQIAPGIVVETFAEPALAAMTKDERDAAGALWRPDGPRAHFAASASGYDFEIVLPWEAMPAADRLDLAHLRVMVDVLSPGSGRRYGPLASTAPARRYGDMTTANRVALASPMRWRLGGCAAVLEADDFYADRNLPGYFLPQREPVLGGFFVLENRPQGYQYSPEAPSPSTVRHVRFARTLARDVVVCGPELAIRRGDRIVTHPDVELSESFRAARVAGGFILMNGPATGLASRLGTGACGACPRIWIGAHFLPEMDGAPQELFGESWIVEDEDIESPIASNARIAVAEDLRTIEVWEFDARAEPESERIWGYARHCYEEEARRYTVCATRANERPPAGLAMPPEEIEP